MGDWQAKYTSFLYLPHLAATPPGTQHRPSSRTAKMELYYAPYSPPCRAVLLTIRYLGLPVTLRKLDMLQRAEHKQVWFLTINPIHTVPALDDNGFTLWESRAIMTYLVQKHGKDDSLYPKDLQQRALVDKMLYFDIGVLYRSIIDYWNPQVLGSEPPDSQKANLLKQSLEYLDTFLKGSKYVCGNHMTVADFSLLASVTTLDTYDYDYSSYSNLKRWVDSFKEDLPFYSDIIGTGVEIAKTWVKTVFKK